VTGADFSGVDIDLLADYIGGVLTGTPEESAVAARIADDPAWQAAYESFGDGMSFVSAELGRLGPEPMPADLADRFDRLLTSFVLLDSTTAAPGEAPEATSPGPTNRTSDTTPFGEIRLGGEMPSLGRTDHASETTPISRLDHHGEMPSLGESGETDAAGATTASWAGADAEAIADAAGHAEGDDARRDAEPDSADPATPPVPHLTLVRGDGAVGVGAHGVRKTQPAPRQGRRLRWAAPIAVAAGLIAFVGFGLDYLAGRSTDSGGADSGSGVSAARGEAPQMATAQQLASGTDYSHATLGTLPMQPMTAPLASSGEPGRKSAPGLANGVEPGLQRLSSPSALAECLAAIERANSGGGLAVESVDYARFAGAPAVIVRFSASNGHWAWASGADCGTPSAGAATLDKVPVG
jgi:hypothetical protein